MPVKFELKDKMSAFYVNGIQYKVKPSPIEGDFCHVFLGERMHDGAKSNICLKVAMDSSDNALLQNEAQALRKLQHQSLPVLIDSFVTSEGKAANVIQRIEDSYDLYSIREHFPSGLPQEHAMWVTDRLLSVLGYLHSNDVLHGSIEPGNIMVTPHNHNGLLIDFTLSLSPPAEKYLGVNDYSAPEIEKGAKPSPASDIYSLGRSMIYLLGGQEANVPSGIDNRFGSFIQGLVRANPNQRKRDAWKALHELKSLRNEIYGESRPFLELKIGGT